MQEQQLINRIVAGVGEQTNEMFQAWFTDNVAPILDGQAQLIDDLLERLGRMSTALAGQQEQMSDLTAAVAELKERVDVLEVPK